MRDAEWLEEEFSALDRVFWHGELEARGVTVSWARFRVTKVWFFAGTFDPNTNKIEINPVLKDDWVPSFFVSAIVYHEMVHASRPDNPGHDRAFWMAAGRHPYMAESCAWWEENIKKLKKARPARLTPSDV